jgi:replicative superfamily II helicase
LVPITEFEPWARNAFKVCRCSICVLFAVLKKGVVKGYERLNRIQSSVFASAYKSNENLLICAPTGAGKTNIAMLAILREIGQV